MFVSQGHQADTIQLLLLLVVMMILLINTNEKDSIDNTKSCGPTD